MRALACRRIPFITILLVLNDSAEEIIARNNYFLDINRMIKRFNI